MDLLVNYTGKTIVLPDGTVLEAKGHTRLHRTEKNVGHVIGIPLLEVVEKGIVNEPPECEGKLVLVPSLSVVYWLRRKNVVCPVIEAGHITAIERVV